MPPSTGVGSTELLQQDRDLIRSISWEFIHSTEGNDNPLHYIFQADIGMLPAKNPRKEEFGSVLRIMRRAVSEAQRKFKARP